MTFRQTALDNRHQLLLSLSYFRRTQNGMGHADLAEEITQVAIMNGFTEQRTPPKGNTLNSWIRNREVPAWALKASSLLLLDIPEYQPKSDEESKALALTLAEAYPLINTPDELVAILANVASKGCVRYLEEAFQVRKV